MLGEKDKRISEILAEKNRMIAKTDELVTEKDKRISEKDEAIQRLKEAADMVTALRERRRVETGRKWGK